MFTGIVQGIGEVSGVEARGAELRVAIAWGDLDAADLACGDSVAVNGVCVTVADLHGGGFAADISRETLSCTTLSGLEPGRRVNLEKSLLPTTRLGGHLVSGHVDAVGTVGAARAAGRSVVVSFAVPRRLMKYVAVKGSVCVDGVSLTVNGIAPAGFDVNLIPHTLERTICGGYRPGTPVNIEVDIVARYLERLLAGGADEAAGGVTYALLAEHGFVDEA